MPVGSCESAVQGRPSEPAVGHRLHLRLDVARLGLRGLRDRRVQPSGRRLAAEQLDAHGVRPRRSGTSAVRPAASVGSRGDSCDNALAETINGLYKAEVIHRRGPCKSKQAVELVTLEWVAWFNHHRLMNPGLQATYRVRRPIPFPTR